MTACAIHMPGLASGLPPLQHAAPMKALLAMLFLSVLAGCSDQIAASTDDSTAPASDCCADGGCCSGGACCADKKDGAAAKEGDACCADKAGKGEVEPCCAEKAPATKPAEAAKPKN